MKSVVFTKIDKQINLNIVGAGDEEYTYDIVRLLLSKYKGKNYSICVEVDGILVNNIERFL